ncbi:hypothetical protein QQF64_029342 [Cirrhinus molitorella]|uniref:Uncharacterized protein n=1 Tax=Cirrhinus molitorella TaxID=172907 RepID=A0ABR3N979_9TELE
MADTWTMSGMLKGLLDDIRNERNLASEDLPSQRAFVEGPQTRPTTLLMITAETMNLSSSAGTHEGHFSLTPVHTNETREECDRVCRTRS